MTPVVVTRHVNAPPDIVWQVATDIPSAADTLRGVDRVEMVSAPGPFGVGSRWRETRTIAKKQVTEEMWATAVEQGTSYTVEADSRGVHYVSRFDFRPTPGGAGTEVTLTFDGQVTGGAVKRGVAVVMQKLMGGVVAKQLGKDLEDIGRAAEARARA